MASCLGTGSVIGKPSELGERFLCRFLKGGLAMQTVIMAGGDVHDKTILVKVGIGRGRIEKRSVTNTVRGRKELVARLKTWGRQEGAERIVFAYEASGLGFGLYDELTEAGIECFVLAPTKMARSPKHRSCKTDDRDAEGILELLRGHMLAGNALPSVWVPDKETRDDREVVRARLDAADKRTALKTQVRCLLKRNGVVKPGDLGKGWTVGYRGWLQRLCGCPSDLAWGARTALASLLRQLESVEQEIAGLEDAVEALSQMVRYAEAAAVVRQRSGVGLVTAMVFLSEMGDLSRFSNRKQVGSYLGLAPRSNDSGERDCKGHITHQGPSQIRKVLCQAAWSVVRLDPVEKPVFERLVARNPKRKKVALVACMRRLGIWMWHRGLEAQRAAGAFAVQESAASA